MAFNAGGRARAYLELIRLPNLFTVVADVLAGYLYTGGDWFHAPALVGLCGASMCLYAGGMALNDVCDRRQDACERPDRPIPSNRVPAGRALALSMVLLTTGVVLAASTGLAQGGSLRVGAVAVTLVGAIVLYDAVLKATVVAPALMGLCRTMNLALGMCHTGIECSAVTLAPLALMWLYVTSLTYFAAREAALIGDRRRLMIGTVGVLVAIGGLSSLYWIVPDVQPAFLLLVALFGPLLAYVGFLAVTRPDSLHVQQAVAAFISGIVALDACIAWSARGGMTALLVATTLLPTILLRRWFPMT